MRRRAAAGLPLFVKGDAEDCRAGLTLHQRAEAIPDHWEHVERLTRVCRVGWLDVLAG